jgi:predicted transcriptional regulator
VATAPPDTTLAEFFWNHLLGRRERAVPVVDGHRYCGVMRIEELRDTPEHDWVRVTVAERMRTDFPTIGPRARLRDALTTMERADLDLLPVVERAAAARDPGEGGSSGEEPDQGDTFVGVVTTSEILKLDDILDRTGPDPP